MDEDEVFDCDAVAAMAIDKIMALSPNDEFTFAQVFNSCGVDYDQQRYFALFSKVYNKVENSVRLKYEGAFEGLPFNVEYIKL